MNSCGVLLVRRRLLERCGEAVFESIQSGLDRRLDAVI
jgi:hypothetical protein